MRRRTRVWTAVAALVLASGGTSNAQSLTSDRDRLLADWAPRVGYGSNVCAAWNSLSSTAQHVFVWNTHRLFLAGILDDVTALYSIAGSDSSCGGGDNNRTFMSMTPDLQSRMRNVAGGGTAIPGWRETHDPACGPGGLPSMQCPHVPFTQQIETTSNGPTGQIQFFPSPNSLHVIRQWRDPLAEPPGSVCESRVFWVERGTEPLCPQGGCSGVSLYCSATATYGDFIRDPEAPYYRSAVGYAIQDPYSFEMDQDFGVAHHSSPSNACGYRPVYQSHYGDPGWDWRPSACTPPPPPPCSYHLSSSQHNVGAGAGTGSVGVTANCAWTAERTGDWVSITSGGAGSGDGQIAYSFTANPSPNPRTASIALPGATLLIQQAGAPCSFSLTPASQSFASGGGSGTAALTATFPTCGWSASTSVSWITVTSSTASAGSATVVYAVAPNPGFTSRTGTLTVAGRSVSVTQGGRARMVPSDFDGDGRSDVALFRPSTGQWLGVMSSTGQSLAIGWGVPGDVPVAADYDADRRTDVAVWRPSTGQWFAILSTTGVGQAFAWGAPGDVPVPGDYDGDGRTDAAIWRPSLGQWLGYLTGSGGTMSAQWGWPSDVPVPADYDGDGRTDRAVFRPSTGEWLGVASGTGAALVVPFGSNGDRPVPGDFDGDGKADLAFFRPSTGEWRRLLSASGATMSSYLGVAGDVPVLGDYDGDGRTDLAVFRPSNGYWYGVYSSSGGAVAVPFGLAGDIPANRARPW